MVDCFQKGSQIPLAAFLIMRLEQLIKGYHIMLKGGIDLIDIFLKV